MLDVSTEKGRDGEEIIHRDEAKGTGSLSQSECSPWVYYCNQSWRYTAELGSGEFGQGLREERERERERGKVSFSSFPGPNNVFGFSRLLLLPVCVCPLLAAERHSAHLSEDEISIGRLGWDSLLACTGLR